MWNGQTRSIATRTRLAVAFIGLNALDIALTCYALQANIGYEGNPVLAGFSLWQMAAFKMVAAALVVRALGRRSGLMSVLTIGMALVVVWNVWVVM